MKGFLPVVLIGVMVWGIYFYIMPQYEQILTLRAEQERYDTALAAADVLKARRDELVRKRDQFSAADEARLEKFLPDQTDDVRLVLDITSIADSHDISLEDIALSTAANESSRRDADEEEEVDTFVQAEYDVETLQVGFTFEADYDQFIDFLSDLKSSLRVMDVTQLNFEVNNNPESSADYIFFMSIETYWVE